MKPDPGDVGENEYPRVLTHDELHFDIDFALKQIPRSMLRNWASTNDLKSERARELMVSAILARFDRYQVRAPAPTPAHDDRSLRPE